MPRSRGDENSVSILREEGTIVDLEFSIDLPDRLSERPQSGAAALGVWREPVCGSDSSVRQWSSSVAGRSRAVGRIEDVW
jgi:hypothetical protein